MDINIIKSIFESTAANTKMSDTERHVIWHELKLKMPHGPNTTLLGAEDYINKFIEEKGYPIVVHYDTYGNFYYDPSKPVIDENPKTTVRRAVGKLRYNRLNNVTPEEVSIPFVPQRVRKILLEIMNHEHNKEVFYDISINEIQGITEFSFNNL